jgi:triacylglycerol esterase/lipase EstA (alpha/beta hydrolase family)
MSVLPIIDVPPPPAPRSGWSRVGAGLATAARATGGAIAAAYDAVDPDLRWHVAQLPLLGLTMLGRRSAAPQARPDDGRRPLVFLHGLGGHRGNFLPMMTWLRLHGRRRLYAWGIPPGDIEDLARALPAFLDEVLRVNGLPATTQVDLVAHSMGGLVARCALEDPAVAARVATLVTFGTPHGGSHAARFLATTYHRALRPDSPLMTRLAAPWSSPTRLVCFWSRADVLLLPCTTARVDGAENHELEGATHYGYLLRADCWRRALDALER